MATMRSPTVVSTIALCIVLPLHAGRDVNDNFSLQRRRKPCTNTRCGDKRPISEALAFIVGITLYDKPYARKAKKYFCEYFRSGLFRRCCNSIRSERILASHEARWLRKPAVKTRSIISNYALLAGANACWTTGKRVIYPTIGSFLDDDLYFERLHTGRSQHLRTRLPKRIKRGTV